MPNININHIVMNIEYILGKDLNICFYYILEYNLLFKLQHFLYFCHVSNFFLNITLCQGYTALLNRETN